MTHQSRARTSERSSRRHRQQVHASAPFATVIAAAGRGQVGRARRCRTSWPAPRPRRRRGRPASAGSVTEPRSPVSVTVGPWASYVVRLTRATGARAVARVGLVAVLHRAVVDQLLPGGQREGLGGSSRQRREAVATHRGRRARRPTAPSRSSRRAPRRRCGSRAGWPELASSSAMPARIRRSGSELGLAKTASKVRGRPSQVTNMPGLSLDRRDREDDVGGAGHVGLAELERDHERRGRDRGAGRGRVAGVVGVDATDDQATELAGDQARRRSRRRRGRRSRAGGRRPSRRRRRPGRPGRRPDGHRAAGWAGSRSRRHRGHRRDAAPRRAGHRSWRPARRRR